jgi:hypothetical protein
MMTCAAALPVASAIGMTIQIARQVVMNRARRDDARGT